MFQAADSDLAPMFFEEPDPSPTQEEIEAEFCAARGIARNLGRSELMGLFHWFSTPKPTPRIVIKNVLGEVLLEIPGRHDLVGANLKGLNLAHADLSNVSLWGAQCDGINLFGARLFRTDFQRASLRGAELAFSYAAGASFRGADLRECSLYRAEIGLGRRHSSADFTDALVNEASDIPEIKVFGERRL